MPTISGIVRDSSGTPCEALIRVLRRSDMSLVANVFSDPSTGAYSVTTADNSPHVVERYVAPILDKFFNNTSLLVHATDSGLVDTKGHAVTLVGNAQRNTVVTDPFGGNSGVAEFDGTGAYIKYTTSADFSIGSANYNFGFWIYQNSIATRQMILATGIGGLSIAVNTAGNIEVCRARQAIDFTFATGLTNGVWNYIDIDRSGTTLVVRKNSTQLASQTSSTTYVQGDLYLGVDSDETSTPLNGYLKEIRLTNGVSRSAYLPTAAFPDALIGAPTENAQIFDNVIPV